MVIGDVVNAVKKVRVDSLINGVVSFTALVEYLNFTQLEVIRVTRRGHQRHLERLSEAIRGTLEAIRGTRRDIERSLEALRGRERYLEATRGNERHSDALT